MIALILFLTIVGVNMVGLSVLLYQMNDSVYSDNANTDKY
jgi:hypothetical protein